MGDLNTPYVVLAAPGAPRFPLDKPEIGVGRTPDNLMHIDHPELSRHHARFLRRENDTLLQDLNSRNGTFVNGRRLDGTARLNDLDRIELAGIAMVYHAPTGPEARRVPAQGGAVPAAQSIPPQPVHAAPTPSQVPSPLASSPPSSHLPVPMPIAPPHPPADPSVRAGQPLADGSASAPQHYAAPAPQAALEAAEGGPPALLGENEMRIGRMPANNLVVPDPQVSSRHALIQNQGGHFVLYDLGSTNGTYVNGRRITQPCELQPGDEIRMGERTFYFRRLAPAPGRSSGRAW
jgi:pSer/pThr/pTyr-binding forkhead associated (FHA) protein